MADVVSTFSPGLGKFETLDIVGSDGIHVTFQGLGFADEVSVEDVSAIAAAVDRRCTGTGAIEIELEQPHVDTETVQMNVGPVRRLAEIRNMIREGIGEVWGSANVPESDRGFRPHITLAYSNGARSMREIEQGIRGLHLSATKCRVESISLIRLNRDARRYEWEEIATVLL
jgi:2'-5' RNA ligase